MIGKAVSISISDITGSRFMRLARSILVIAAAWYSAATGLLFLSPAKGLAAEQPPLTFVTWGGAYTRSQILAFVRPYQERTGMRVDVLDYHGGLEAIRDQVWSLNVKWDVVDLELSDAIRGCEEGLLEPIDTEVLEPAPDGTPPSRDFIKGTITRCAIGTVVWSTVIAYNTKAVRGEPPTTLRDFFDLGRYPGRRGLRKTPKTNLEWALMADGVPRARVYDVLETAQGLARAFDVLDRIKSQIVWWQGGEEAPRLLETGRVVMTSAYNGRIYDAVVRRDQPFEIIWDRQVWNIDLLGIPKGSPQLAQAKDFIRFATSTKRLAEQARHIPYGPVRRSSLQRLSGEIRPHLPTEQHNFEHALKINAAWWARHYERINRVFEQWLQRPVQVPRALPR